MGSIRIRQLILTAIILALNLIQITSLPILSTTSQSGRFLAEKSTNVSDDTVRVDPLDSFKKYRGGYDITNKHYWASTAYTGIPGYAIAVLWLLCGLVYGGFLLVKRLCCNISRRKLKKKSPCHNQCYLKPLLFAVFLTILAITATGLVLGGNAKFHTRAKTVIDIIIDTADEASDTIYKTTGAMKEMSISLRDADGSTEATRFLTSTSLTLDSQAADIAKQASKNRRLIDKGFKIVYIITTLTISLTLVSVIALLVLGVLKFQRIVQILIGVCWILTALCWLFFGIYFFLQNFAGDTCTALKSFQKDPYNNSLSSILPCDELLSSKSVLNDISVGIYDLVNEVNLNISRSYGNIVQICNPFSPPPMHEYQPLNCPSTAIQIGDIPHVLRMLVCPDNGGEETCNGGILVSADYFNTVEAYSTSIQKILDVYPGMESLVECGTVSNAFDEIIQKHCGPLKGNVRMVWRSMVFLSVVMAALVVVWTISGAPDEKNSRSLGGSSVKPHCSTSVTADHALESGTVKIAKDDSDVRTES
ncbi:hypothetical protein MIMGU_mgv1a004324mg [Erythranthe guttata]|uniref:Uncharacterized protein n=2 Tax=Erythranthe guttata TaxID=4155 RepID=A0A022RAE9_ERYGU|nr:hypothetical protein MIMGU_mgv1a004324mg [Erythranthe guttata]